MPNSVFSGPGSLKPPRDINPRVSVQTERAVLAGNGTGIRMIVPESAEELRKLLLAPQQAAPVRLGQFANRMVGNEMAPSHSSPIASLLLQFCSDGWLPSW